MTKSSLDIGESLDLEGHFPPVLDGDWLVLVLRDLELEEADQLAWTIPDGPRVQPFYTTEPARTIPAIQPGWKYVESVEIVDPVAESLADARQPDFKKVCLDGRIGPDLRPWDEGGAGLATLTAAAFGSVSEWMTCLMERDVPPDKAAGSLTVVVPVGTSFFPSIAMLRAVRLGVDQVVRAFGATTSPLIMAVTAASCLTDVDAYGNLLRTTTGAMASIMGGADELSVLPFDYKTGASERGRRLAANISHLLSEEAHLARVADPAAGCYYVERLTEALGNQAWSLFQSWEAAGGLGHMIADGAIARLLEPLLAARADRISSGGQVVVGLNRFQEPVEQS